MSEEKVKRKWGRPLGVKQSLETREKISKGVRAKFLELHPEKAKEVKTE